MKLGEKLLFGIVGLLVLITVISFFSLESIRHHSDKPLYPILTHYEFSEEGKKGYGIYEQKGCYECHHAVGSGTSMGLSLDGIGSRHDATYFYNFLKNPENTYGAKTLDHGMPPKDAAYVSELPDDDLRAMAVFVSELKADQGSSSSFEPPEEQSSFVDAMVHMWTPAGWKTSFTDIREWIKNNPKEDQHDPKH